jgi:hypothetical protein
VNEIGLNLDLHTFVAMTAVSNAVDRALETIVVPSPVSCVDAREINGGLVVLVGTEDGTIRRYASASYKVTKALRGLSKGVSWLRFSTLKDEEDCFWVSSGMEVRNFLRVKILPLTSIH